LALAIGIQRLMTVTQIYTNMHKHIPIMSTSTKIKIPKTIDSAAL